MDGERPVVSLLATDTGGGLPGWAKPAFVLATGVVLSGLADFALTEAGYPSLATLVWVAGYGGVVVVVWAVWLRELDFEPGG